jgi:dolichol kinase
MFIEAPQWKIGNIEIDDNLLIPIAAGSTLTIIT